MFEQAFKDIDETLRREAGCTTEPDYTEQTSWLLFLKYLDALEQDKAAEAALERKKYTFLLDKPYRWDEWAAPKAPGNANLPIGAPKNPAVDHNKAKTGDDLRDFVNLKLFPSLHGFKQKASGPNTIEYKSAKFSAKSKTRSRAATTCARSSTTSTSCASARRPRSTNCPISTKPKSKTWARRAQRRRVLHAPPSHSRVQVIQPKLGERIYDGACGSAGFLSESFEYLKSPGNANLPIGGVKDAIQENGTPRSHSRGYLPHFESSDVTQHVTFHLADSLPQIVLLRLEAELKILPPISGMSNGASGWTPGSTRVTVHAFCANQPSPAWCRNRC